MRKFLTILLTTAFGITMLGTSLSAYAADGSVTISYSYDKEYPVEVMQTLPEEEVHSDLETVSPAQPSSVFVRSGDAFYEFAGWDKETIQTQDGDSSFLGTWIQYDIPKEYLNDLFVKFVDADGNAIESGSFTDSLFTGGVPPYSAASIVLHYDRETGNVIITHDALSNPPVVQERPNSYETRDGYRLVEQCTIGKLDEDGFEVAESSNHSTTYTFSEIETPAGYLALEGSVKATFDLDAESITITSDDTKRAYVEGRTLFIVYLPIDRAGARAALENYKNPEDYADEQKEEIARILEDANGEINEATTQEQLNEIVKNAKTKLDGVKTKAQLDEDSAEQNPGEDKDDNAPSPDNDSKHENPSNEREDVNSDTHLDNPAPPSSNNTSEERNDPSSNENTSPDRSSEGTPQDSVPTSTNEEKSHYTSPKTGDSASAPLFVGLFSITLITLVIAVRKRTVREGERNENQKQP